MDGAKIAELGAGAAVIALGALVLRYNAAVAEQIAEWNKFKYDRRATLYDLDRAERLRRIYDAGPLDRLGAAVLGVVLVLVGALAVLDTLT
jgi:hypothetical protein